METARTVTDGQRVVTADALKGGWLYVLTEGEDGEQHLRHIPRSDDELPRLRVAEEAVQALRAFCRGMRKEMGGYRPDITLVGSALLLDAVSKPDASRVVREYAVKKFLGDEAQPSESHHAQK